MTAARSNQRVITLQALSSWSYFLIWGASRRMPTVRCSCRDDGNDQGKWRLPTPGEMVPISGTQVVIVAILALADLPVPDELRPRIDQAVASPDCWLD